MREVPTADSTDANDNFIGGGEVVPHTESRLAIDPQGDVGEVSDGTEMKFEIQPLTGSVGVSPDSDVRLVEIGNDSVRCPGGVAA